MSPAQMTAVKISGTGELKYTKRETVDVPGQEGHVLMVAESHGRNRNTGSDEFFANAETSVVELTDFRQGRATQEGYIRLSKGGDSVLSRWQGVGISTPVPNKPPQLSVRGTWECIHGTGRYHGIEGGGTYEGEFIDEDRYVLRWEGERIGGE